ALAGRRVAGAGRVALVGRAARDRVHSHAHTRLAGVRLRAEVPVAARGPVGLVGVGAVAGHRVAGGGRVALVGRAARDRAHSHAHTRLAGVRLRAEVPVAARGPVGLVGVR